MHCNGVPLSSTDNIELKLEIYLFIQQSASDLIYMAAMLISLSISHLFNYSTRATRSLTYSECTIEINK